MAFLVDPEVSFQVEHQEGLVVAFPAVHQEGLVVAYPEEHHEVAFQLEPYQVAVPVEEYLVVHHAAACLVAGPHWVVDHVVAFLVEGLDLQVAFLEVHHEILVVVRQEEDLLADLEESRMRAQLIFTIWPGRGGYLVGHQGMLRVELLLVVLFQAEPSC